MKKLLTLLLVCMMLLPLIPVMAEETPITISLYYSDNPTLPFREDWPALRAIQEKYNVKLNHGSLFVRKNTVEVILRIHETLFVLKKLIQTQFVVNSLRNGISQILPVGSVRLQLFLQIDLKLGGNAFSFLIHLPDFFLKMSNWILVLIQPVLQETEILYDFALYFSIFTIPADNG